MAEYFELTFFLEKEKAKKEQSQKQILEALGLTEGKNQISNHQYPLFAGKKVLFDVFEYDEVDFLEYRICLAELVFTKKNFEEKINQLLQVVKICFNEIAPIIFATGIYELTYDCVKEIAMIKDFNKAIFSKFPILFFKTGHEYGFHSSYANDSVSCVINKDVQDIFANPIKELMEDYGMSFEEAEKQIKLDHTK